VETENARDRAELDAEALGLSQQYVLGDCTGSWLKTSYLVRVIFGWIIIVISLITLIDQLSPADYQAGLAQLALIAIPVGALLIWIRPRSRRVRVYLFEGGVARVANTGPGRRLVVLPWSELDRVTAKVDVDDLLDRCELRGRSGTKLVLEKYDAYPARLAIKSAAEAVLADRSAAG
jgi:hypothetical protein